jgi:hypothetical protein
MKLGARHVEREPNAVNIEISKTTMHHLVISMMVVRVLPFKGSYNAGGTGSTVT